MSTPPTPDARSTRVAPSSLPSPKRLYGALALAEMITWALLLFGMALKYSGMTDRMVPIFGMLHGVVFVSYCVVTVFVWVNGRWGAKLGLLGLASAIVPFCTYPFERAMLERGRIGGSWRLGPDGEEPRGFVERVQAWCLRNVLLAIVIGVFLVAAIVTVLLIIGPPIPKG